MNETLYECPNCGYVITQEEYNDFMNSSYDWDCGICKLRKVSEYLQLQSKETYTMNDYEMR